MEPKTEITQIITASGLEEKKQTVLLEMVKNLASHQLKNILVNIKANPEILDALSENILMKIEYLKGDSGITEESIVEYEKQLVAWLGE